MISESHMIIGSLNWIKKQMKSGGQMILLNKINFLQFEYLSTVWEKRGNLKYQFE